MRKSKNKKTNGQSVLPGLDPNGLVGSESAWERAACASHLGIDEAGRGCLAGPVVAAAVFAPDTQSISTSFPGLDDSKKLTARKREKLAESLRASAVPYGIGLSWPPEIDRVNILNATFRAMSRAVFTLYHRCGSEYEKAALLVDGSLPIIFQQWEAAWVQDGFMSGYDKENFMQTGLGELSAEPLGLPRLDADATCPALPVQYPVVSGDTLIPAISAASILAKTFSDALMLKLDFRYPGYDFTRHKGYGTADHFEAIARLGLSPVHRKSFCAKGESQGLLL